MLLAFIGGNYFIKKKVFLCITKSRRRLPANEVTIYKVLGQ